MKKSNYGIKVEISPYMQTKPLEIDSYLDVNSKHIFCKWRIILLS